MDRVKVPAQEGRENLLSLWPFFLFCSPSRNWKMPGHISEYKSSLLKLLIQILISSGSTSQAHLESCCTSLRQLLIQKN
jgi:hypothetical protein